MSRRRRAALAVGLLIAGLPLILIGTRVPSPEERQAAADALVAGIDATVTVDGGTLLATRAVADFGLDQPVRLVLVRIADELQVAVGLVSTSDVVLGGPIVACLVGPDAAPDDGGLESPCWGEPEIGPLIEAQLPRGDDGRLRIAAGSPVIVETAVRRGELRCDYPPGRWHLELRVDPIVVGGPAGPRYAPGATFEVPFDPAEPLALVMERRYCGLANRVIREQGEPAIAAD